MFKPLIIIEYMFWISVSFSLKNNQYWTISIKLDTKFLQKEVEDQQVYYDPKSEQEISVIG